ncbi:MAG: hypothetical protein QHC40_01435 [Sphingobium sp.]|nr:hypothetical protein [Sphingobium sp.]
MARFYLHLHNRTGLVPDEEGTELPDLDAARQIAVDAIRDLISEEARSGLIDLRGYIEIAEESGKAAVRIAFSSAVDLHLGEASS